MKNSNWCIIKFFKITDCLFMLPWLFIMQQVAPGPHQMAHYAFGSSLANLGVMLPGMISGWLCDSLGGYHYFFMWALLATVPAFLLAARIPFTHPDTEEVTAEEIDKELINE